MNRETLPIFGQQEAAERSPSVGEFAGTVALVTMGCAKNTVDSEVMLGTLVERGFRAVDDPGNADLIVVNTCGFLQSAVEEGIDRILELSEHKKNGRCRRLVVAGCMVERYRNQLAAEFPEVDRFLSTDELLNIADESGTSTECFEQARRPYFLYDEAMPRVRSTGRASAYVKIAEGCDRPCSFCIIPKLRGGFRSRAIESVLAEIRAQLDAGVKELNFVAQDLTAYGSDFPGNRGVKSELATLLSSLTKFAEGYEPFWTRLLYAYPVGTNEELIRQIIDSPVVCNYLDIPLQHISHPVLKSMRRPLGEKGTRSLVEMIRHVAPQLAIRTTFIVGFPGETEEDVAALRDFIAEGHFAHVGVFTYSQEEEALSYGFEQQIEEDVKQERRALLMETQQSVVQRRLEPMVGQRLRVLVEGPHPETDLLLAARAEWQAPETDGQVIINSLAKDLADSEPAGSFADVEITEFQGYDLIAELVRV